MKREFKMNQQRRMFTLISRLLAPRVSFYLQQCWWQGHLFVLQAPVFLYAPRYQVTVLQDLERSGVNMRKHYQITVFKITPKKIGHFRVPPGLYFKTRVGAQPLIWKSFFILMQIKLIFTRKVVHLASFWKWGFFGARKWPIGSVSLGGIWRCSVPGLTNNLHFCLFVAFFFATMFLALQITKKSVVISAFGIPSLRELVIILVFLFLEEGHIQPCVGYRCTNTTVILPAARIKQRNWQFGKWFPSTHLALWPRSLQ